MLPHHRPAEKDGHTFNRAGKRKRRPERVVCAAAELGWGAGCDVCSGGARAATIRPSGSAIFLASFTLSVDTVTGRPLIQLRSWVVALLVSCWIRAAEAK